MSEQPAETKVKPTIFTARPHKAAVKSKYKIHLDRKYLRTRPNTAYVLLNNALSHRQRSQKFNLLLSKGKQLNRAKIIKNSYPRRDKFYQKRASQRYFNSDEIT